MRGPGAQRSLQRGGRRPGPAPSPRSQAAAAEPAAPPPAGDAELSPSPAARDPRPPAQRCLPRPLCPRLSHLKNTISLQVSKMEAPLVSLDEEFEDLRPCYTDDREEKSHCFYGSSPHHLEDPSFSELENFSSEIISFKSMEDLVNEFDEKLNVCFRNYNAKTENLAPVKNHLQIQEEEENFQDEEVWGALTDNYIPSITEDWRDPSIEVLNGNISDSEIHEKEEEELNEKSENDSGINEEPLLTADQVIEEIEEMMQNSPDPEEEEEILEEDDEGETSSQADSILLQEIQVLTQTFNNNWSYEGLAQMSVSELAELLDQVEGAIRDYSEELVQQLARRDELEFEKEVKNSFITVLMEVQNKQKEHRELMKRRRKEKGLSLQSSRIERGTQMPLKRFSMEGISNILQTGIRQTFGNSATDKQYLNTVIPYEKKGSPPSVEDLQMLTNRCQVNRKINKSHWKMKFEHMK
ncbi:fasciculation and elongation protein zeta-1 isoform X1 [Pelodiscus sinensis]|uniref:fasciculation and elongation protein zeta-1 isoform X1 n=1 Tax=Pelodiscus sinensis TaxID=13735 RepID=UPI003F6C27C6